MFYRTQIKSVTTYGAIDMSGKSLSFIGYLPVKAGDWVYTNGKVIFGNVPSKGSPVVFDEELSGVPVLDSGELNTPPTFPVTFKVGFTETDNYKACSVVITFTA